MATLSESRLSLHRSKTTRYRKQCAMRLQGRILDCGGGLGDYLPYLDGDVTVLDRDIKVLRLLDRTNRLAADAESLPFPDRIFDHVWACAMAQYVHLHAFIHEVTRVTKAGGHVLVLVPNANSPWDAIKKVLGMRTWWDQPGIVQHYTVDELRQYGTVSGEIQFLPLEGLLRQFPRLGHTLMLDITVRSG